MKATRSGEGSEPFKLEVRAAKLEVRDLGFKGSRVSLRLWVYGFMIKSKKAVAHGLRVFWV